MEGNMTKTPKQELLELQMGKPIEQILRDALGRFRGRHNVALAALSLGLATGTVYNWCSQMGIDVGEYRSREEPDRAEIEALKQEVLA